MRIELLFLPTIKKKEDIGHVSGKQKSPVRAGSGREGEGESDTEKCN